MTDFEPEPTPPSAEPPTPAPPTGDQPAPSPFDRPSGEPRRSSGPGVGKPLLIGCGGLLLLLLVAGVLFLVYQNQIAAWLFETMQGQLAPALPDDLPPDVRQRYDRAFDQAIESMRAGSYNPFAMQGAQREFTRAAGHLSGDDAKLSVEDVERLSAALEKIPAEEGGEEPDTAPGTAPSDGGDPGNGAPPPDGGATGTPQPVSAV